MKNKNRTRRSSFVHIFNCTLLLIIIDAFTTSRIYAQNDTTAQLSGHHVKGGFYIRGGAGYAFPHTGNVISYNNYSDFKVQPASFTTGVNGTLGCGYMFNKHIGVELDGTYYAPGKKYNYLENEYLNIAMYNIEDQFNEQAICFAMPGVILKTSFRHFNLYTRLSLALPITNKTSFTGTFDSAGNIIKSTENITNRFTVGFSGAAGVSYKICNHINLWAEMDALAFTPYLKKTELVSSSYNGVSTISNYSNQQKETDYAFSGNYNYYFGSPTFPTFTMPYSNIGIKAGISIDIGGNDVNEVTNTSNRYFYIKGGMGDAAPIADNMTATMTNTTIYNGTEQLIVAATSTGPTIGEITFKNKLVSFSSGYSGIIGGGYMLSDHLGFELDAVGGLNSKKNTFIVSSVEYGSYSKATVLFDRTSYTKLPVLLTPSIVVQTGGKLMNVYSRLGIVLPLSGELIVHESQQTSYQGISDDDINYTTKFTLGYTCAVGFQYHITQQLSALAEVSLLCYEPYVKEEKYSSTTQNNTIEYKSSGNNITTSMYYNNGYAGFFYNAPQPTYTLPYSSVGIKMGVSFRL